MRISLSSLSLAFCATLSAGKAVAEMLAVFVEFERDILRERVKAGSAHTRANGKNHDSPPTAATKKDEVLKLHRKGLNNSEIARKLKIGRSSVIRMVSRKGRVK